tara:strand:- start:14267 stop:14956 length:690 start_codon:yes stop_codon:yes gene_type:complete
VVGISLPPGPRSIVTKHVVSLTKPLPRPNADVKGTGGGFVQYYGTSDGKFSHDMEHTRTTNHFENADLYGGGPWEYQRGGLGQPGLHTQNVRESLDILAPKPVYTSTNYGRWNISESPTQIMYGDDAKAADAWRKIGRRESLARNSKEERAMTNLRDAPAELPVEELEDVDLGGEEPEKKQKRQPTPVQVITMKNPLSREERVAQRVAEARQRTYGGQGKAGGRGEDTI